MRILGIDPSMNSSGWSLFDTSINRGTAGHFKQTIKGIERLANIRSFFKDLLIHQKPDYIFIEQYAYGGRGQDMGEVGGILRLMMYDMGIPYLEISVQHLKKFVTGKGNAKKKEVLDGCNERFGTTFLWKNPSNNESDKADAYALSRFGEELIDLDRLAFCEKYKINDNKEAYVAPIRK